MRFIDKKPSAMILMLIIETKRFVKDNRGDFVGTIGWMAIITTILVMVHGMLKGWLPGFVDDMFTKIETLV